MIRFMHFLLGNKQFNIKALAAIVLTPLVLGVGVYFLHAFQVQRNAQDLLDIALQMEKENQIGKATGLLEQYLGMVPSNDDALAKYGMLMAGDTKNPRARQKAMLALDQVLRRDPSRVDARRKAAEIAVTLGQFNSAREHLELLHKAMPNDVDVLHWYALCETGAGQVNMAREKYAKAVKLDPTRVDLSLEYAIFLHAAAKEPGAAEEEVERLIARNPKSSDARLQVARFYLRTSKADKAEEHVKYCLNELRTTTEDAYLLAADIALAQSKPEEALEFLEQGRKLYPDAGRLQQKVVQVKLAAGNRKDALSILDQMLAKLPDDPDELFNIAYLLIDAGGIDQAEKTIAKMAAKKPGPQVECLQARLLMRKDSWGEARKILEGTINKIRPGAPLGKYVYLMLGDCYQRLGNPDKWLDACRAAEAWDKNWFPARRALADALAATNNLDNALHEYEKLPPTPDLLWKVINVQLARTLKMKESERRWNEVQKALEAFAKLPPKEQEKFNVPLLLTNIAAAQKKYSLARKLMEAQRQRDPKQIDPWMVLINLAELTEKPDRVDKVQALLLANAEKAVGERSEWHLVRARLALKKPEAEARQTLLALEKTAAALPAVEGDRLRSALAEYYLLLGKAEDAERLWKDLATSQPQALGVRIRLLERYYQQGKDGELIRLVEEIRRIEGGAGPYTCYGEASHYMLRFKSGDQKAVAQAREWLTAAGKQRSSWSRVYLLEAEALEIENLKDQAIEKYKLAIEQGENRLGVLRHVFQLMIQKGAYLEANTLLHSKYQDEKAISSAGFDRLDAQLTALTATESAQNPVATLERAYTNALKSVKKESKEYREWLWLGQMAAMAKKTKEAEEHFRKAVELNDATVETWATLILYLASTSKDTSSAKAELARAQKKLPPDKAALVLAPAHEAMGEIELAEKYYQESLKSDPYNAVGLRNFALFLTRTGQSAKAEVELRKLLDPAAKATKETHGWARRNLALTLVARGGYQRFKEAQKLLDQNLRDSGDQLEDQLAKAMVLASQPDQRAQAIALCESLSSKLNTVRPEMVFFLAQLYEANGDWRQAKQQLDVLSSTQSKNPVFLAYYTRALLRHIDPKNFGSDLREAQASADNLAKIAPTAWQSYELRAQVLQKMEKKDEAKKLVLEYVKQKDARIELAGVLMDSLGHFIEAERMFRDYMAASKKPEAAFLLAQFMAKHQRVSEALALCEESLKTAPPERVVHCAVVILRLGKGTPQDQAKVEAWLKKAESDQPQNLMIQILHAEVEDLRGRYTEAAGVYRQILQKAPDNVIALNNLAFLLAVKKESLQDSLRMIDKAIDIAGPQAQLLDTRAMVHLQLGDSAKAIADLQQAISQGGSADNYFHLALAQRQAKNRMDATTAFQKAGDLGLRAEQVHSLERPLLEEMMRDLNLSLGKSSP